MTALLDASGNLHSGTTGRFTGHSRAEADTGQLLAFARPATQGSSPAYSGKWRGREWNDAEFTCPVCGRDIGEDYHEWDSEDGTHLICQAVGTHLNVAGTAIAEDDFDDLFGVERTPSGDLFEFDDVATEDEHHVWTIVDDGQGSLYAAPGFHSVNRMGYIKTERPWDDDVPDAEWSVSNTAEV